MLKRSVFAVVVIAGTIGLLIYIAMNFMVIKDPTLEDCLVRQIEVVKIEEGSDYDIFFTDADGDRYYINRGLERGLKLNSLKNIVLNQQATIHLPKFAVGVSGHIAQLTVKDSIVYTEFD